MRVRGEIVFPNNLKELRLRKQLTQAELGRLMDPPVGESTISKMESGERRLTNLQLANIATLLGCSPEAIPVMATRDPAPGVRRWQSIQEERVRQSIVSGAAAAYVLAQLRKKSRKSMQQVAKAVGMTLSVYHRVEMASRIIHSDEIGAIANFYGLPVTKLIAMFEQRAHENRAQLEQRVPPEKLLPRTPRSLLKEDGKWGRLGPLERSAIRRSVRYVATPQCATELPVYGKMATDTDGVSRFKIDRSFVIDRIALGELLAADAETFLVRNFSRRLGLLLKPGALALIDPHTPVAVGDIGFLVRHDGTAEAAAVIGDELQSLKLKMYNPEESLPMDNQEIAAALRIRIVILP